MLRKVLEVPRALVHPAGDAEDRHRALVAEAVREARHELGRADAKAGTLLTLATGALAGLLTLIHTRVPLAAVALLWFAAALVTGSLAMLLLVVRSDVGSSSVMFHDHKELLDTDPGTERRWQENRLRKLSRSAVTRHIRVRRAVDLLLGALATLVVAAVVIAAW